MTVSYTCQKPIKFWAKCKINLLYKLNQSLLCVPGCPLLLATRLRTWAPHLLPLILYFSLCVRTNPFPPWSYVLPYWSPFGLLFAQPSFCAVFGPALQIPGKPLYLLLTCLPPGSTSPLCRTWWEPLLPSSIFLYWIQMAPSPFSNPLYIYVT